MASLAIPLQDWPDFLVKADRGIACGLRVISLCRGDEKQGSDQHGHTGIPRGVLQRSADGPWPVGHCRFGPSLQHPIAGGRLSRRFGWLGRGFVRVDPRIRAGAMPGLVLELSAVNLRRMSLRRRLTRRRRPCARFPAIGGAGWPFLATLPIPGNGTRLVVFAAKVAGGNVVYKSASRRESSMERESRGRDWLESEGPIGENDFACIAFVKDCQSGRMRERAA